MSDLSAPPEPASEPNKLDYAIPAATPPKGAMSTLFFIVLMDLLGFGVIIPLMPFYAVRYHASSFQVGLIFSLYSLCQLIASPILGILSDRYGRRPVLIFSQFGSAAGFAMLGIVTQLDAINAGLALMLIYVSRIIDGVSAGNISTAQAYIGDVTTPENRAKGMGVLGAAFGIGFAVGPAIGGLAGHFSVSLPAYIASGFALSAMFLTFFLLPETRVHKHLDGDEALLHPSKISFILKQPALLQLNLIWFLCMGAFVMMETIFALYVSRPDTFRYGPTQVGWLFGLAGLVIIGVQGGLIGRLTKAFGEWPLAIAGPALVTVGMMIYTSTAWHPWLALLIIAGLFNASGRSLFGPSLSSLVSKLSPPDRQGTVFGLYHALGSLARVIGPVVAGLLYDRHRTGPFVLGGLITLAAASWGLFLMSRPADVATPSESLQPS